MPRPTRMQYPGAYYHVMNRGRGRQPIFHDERYYRAFLATVTEAHDRFLAVVHAYCLMGNHYHLLIQTPEANLDRIMRHINGVYTQRYNHLKRTDGPLFRGRYKAILVDADAYLLQLSRYIHRNPVDTKKPLVKHLEEYPWSSYPAYLGKAPCPEWLHREQVYGQLNSRHHYRALKRFVETGVDDETASLYGKGNLRSIIGDKAFRQMVDQKAKMSKGADRVRALQEELSIERITKAIGDVFGVSLQSIVQMQQGRQRSNLARKVAMYACQQYGRYKLISIANAFGLKNPGGVSYVITEVRRLVDAGELDEEIRQLESHLNLIQLS